MGEEKVKISRAQKALLEELRKDDTGHRGLDSVTGKQVSATHGTVERTDRGNETAQGRVQGPNIGSEQVERSLERHNQGGRPTISEGVDTRTSLDRDSETSRERPSSTVNSSVTQSVTPDDEERKKELARQRQERFRSRKNQAQKRDVTVESDNASGKPKFSLKNPLATLTQHSNVEEEKPDVKLISKTEVTDLETQLAYVYQHGSGILDDIIEIIVKEHESVTIWQLDEDEARMLAHMHLEQGRVSAPAAASARKLVGLYDKIFLLTLLAPRAVATGKHVVSKGGFSIR